MYVSNNTDNRLGMRGLTFTCQRICAAHAVSSKKRVTEKVQPTIDVHFLHHCLSGVCLNSQNSSRMSHDVLQADRKHFVKDIICCDKGRERVNKDTSRFVYSTIHYDFIVPMGKFVNAVEISVVDPRSLSVVERI